jgi:hypothetical protein
MALRVSTPTVFGAIGCTRNAPSGAAAPTALSHPDSQSASLSTLPWQVALVEPRAQEAGSARSRAAARRRHDRIRARATRTRSARIRLLAYDAQDVLDILDVLNCAVCQCALSRELVGRDARWLKRFAVQQPRVAQVAVRSAQECEVVPWRGRDGTRYQLPVQPSPRLVQRTPPLDIKPCSTRHPPAVAAVGHGWSAYRCMCSCTGSTCVGSRRTCSV